MDSEHSDIYDSKKIVQYLLNRRRVVIHVVLKYILFGYNQKLSQLHPPEVIKTVLGVNEAEEEPSILQCIPLTSLEGYFSITITFDGISCRGIQYDFITRSKNKCLPSFKIVNPTKSI